MKSKILAVDNETDILEILSFNLKNEGYEVFTASNGLEAIEKTKKNLPDLILLDIMMEGMDGIEVCRNLKEDKATRNIPIIFLSAKGEELDKILGLELGADDYITK
ncbi:MAG: response regulator, partial [Spirochaetes bacterium]|nr:response regulator [Spirochaetota bacterium]